MVATPSNADILYIWPSETNLNEISIKIKVSFNKMHLKIYSVKYRPFLTLIALQSKRCEHDTENLGSLWCQLCRHWRHRKLLWCCQHPIWCITPVTMQPTKVGIISTLAFPWRPRKCEHNGGLTYLSSRVWDRNAKIKQLWSPRYRMYVSDSTPTRIVDNGRMSLFAEH